MTWNKDLAANLPPPNPDEPADLRHDILDELADHLACAMARETRRHPDDDVAAARAVVDRFGDPTRIARRLWLDAMKETLMTHRLTVSLLAVLAAASLTLCALLWMSIRSSDARFEALLVAMQTQTQMQAAPASTWSTLAVTLHLDDASGPPAQGWEVVLVGALFNDAAQDDRVKAVIDASGRASLGPIRPGQYQVVIESPDGETRAHRTVTMFPGTTSVDWFCRPARPEAVRFDLSLPADVIAAGPTIMVVGTPIPEGGWLGSLSRSYVVAADGAVIDEASDGLTRMKLPGRSITFPSNASAFDLSQCRVDFGGAAVILRVGRASVRHEDGAAIITVPMTDEWIADIRRGMK